MASTGIGTLLDIALAKLPPIKPRKVCRSPVSFQWRARLSSRSFSPAATKCQHVDLPVHAVDGRRLRGGKSLTQELRASGEGAPFTICRRSTSLVEYRGETVDEKGKPNSAVNTECATMEELAVSGTALDMHIPKGNLTSQADFEDQWTYETATRTFTTGPSTYDSWLGLFPLSTKRAMFLQISRIHWDHTTSKRSLLNDRKGFATAATPATARTRDETKAKQTLEHAGVANSSNREQDAPRRRLGHSTVVDTPAATSQVNISTKVRQAMRTMPQPVCIVTSTDVSTGAPVFRGATISSFNTVTIEPTTIVSLNIKRPSSTFDAIESSRYFIVHLLKADQVNSDLANAFTKGNSSDPFRTLQVSQVEWPDASEEAAVANAGPPLIENCSSPGRLLCRYLPQKTVQLGDHVVVFGSVGKLVKRLNDVDQSHMTCLAYANGQYGSVSPFEHSSPPQVSRAALDDFISKIELMDHSCLRTITWSHPYWHLLPTEMKVSLRNLRFRSRDLLHCLQSDPMLNLTKRQTLRMGFQTRPLSSLGEGILKAITFYQIFVASMHGVEFLTSGAILLPPEASDALHRYQMVALDTYSDLANIGRTLQKLQDLSTDYQPPVSDDIYSLDKIRCRTVNEHICHLYDYLGCCLTPMAVPKKSTGTAPVLQHLVTQYDTNLRNLQKENHNMASKGKHRANDLSRAQPNAAHAQARAAIMHTYREVILPSWVRSAAKKAGHHQNTSESFQGLGDGVMSWLGQYNEICKETAKHLHHYKTFLVTSGLEKYYDKGNGSRPSLVRGPPTTLSDTLLRKRVGRRLVASSNPSARRPFGRAQPTLLGRYHVPKPKELSKTHKPNEDIPIARRDLGQPLPAKEVRFKLRPRLLNPYARQMEEAELQEVAIQRGLEDLDKLMAEEGGQRPR